VPDAAHSIAFWSSVAGAFKLEPNVALELYSEYETAIFLSLTTLLAAARFKLIRPSPS
jgi:hypothetical protein